MFTHLSTCRAVVLFRPGKKSPNNNPHKKVSRRQTQHTFQSSNQKRNRRKSDGAINVLVVVMLAFFTDWSSQ